MGERALCIRRDRSWGNKCGRWDDGISVLNLSSSSGLAAFCLRNGSVRLAHFSASTESILDRLDVMSVFTSR